MDTRQKKGRKSIGCSSLKLYSQALLNHHPVFYLASLKKENWPSQSNILLYLIYYVLQPLPQTKPSRRLNSGMSERPVRQRSDISCLR